MQIENKNQKLFENYSDWCEKTSPLLRATIDALYGSPFYGQSVSDDFLDFVDENRNEFTDELFELVQRLREMI